MRDDIRSDVDFVLTFEEMDGIFDARHVDIENLEEDAGGVSDAKKVREMMELGADGVQVASRFVTTYECDASEEFKKAYITATTQTDIRAEDVKKLLSQVSDKVFEASGIRLEPEVRIW